MSEITAKIVADSITRRGNCRVTTFIIKAPRFLLAELNTHRMLSRNSASNRARPLSVTTKDVTNDPFAFPLGLMAAHKGMQGSDFLDDATLEQAKKVWLKMRDDVIAGVLELDRLGVTKQITNRPLEPFSWHEAIVSGTDWENFFALRAHPDTEIHLARLATLMLEAYNASMPKLLKEGEWHVPFGDCMDMDKIRAIAQNEAEIEKIKLQIAAARCARISYKPFGDEAKYDYAADLRLFKTLVDGNHVSPLEHGARAMTEDEWDKYVSTRGEEVEKGWCGNFRGFIQLRKLYPSENRKDPRVLPKLVNEQGIVYTPINTSSQ